MSTLSSYLAKNYLTASTSTDHSERPKKRRKKGKSSDQVSTLVIADDDDDLLLSSSSARKRDNETEDGMPMMYEGKQRSAEFRRKKDSSWQSVSQGPSTGTAKNSEKRAEGQDEAETILASAAADQEDRRREIEMDDAPAVVSDHDHEDGGGLRMESGVKAGLQTAADTARLLEKEVKQRKREDREARKSKKNELEEETIYRDATGRRIDVSLRRAEIRKQQEEQERAKRKEREEAMGDVQRTQKEERKQELDEAKFLTLGRSQDDVEMNERLKEEVRWDDPMAAYMREKQMEEGERRRDVEMKGKPTGATAKTRARTYQGHAPPNRYGIAPGWRWDGVDRGNGFEKGVVSGEEQDREERKP